MSTTTSYQSSSTNQQNKPDTTMARSSSPKPSSRSSTPPTDGTPASSKHNIWTNYNTKLGNMYPTLVNEQPVEHHYRHSKPSSKEGSKQGSKQASKSNSGSNTPDREAKEKKHNANFFDMINERLDRSYDSHARPEADKAIEEAKKEGEERQKKGIISSIRERGAFGAFEKTLDRAHDSSHRSQQS